MFKKSFIIIIIIGIGLAILTALLFTKKVWENRFPEKVSFSLIPSNGSFKSQEIIEFKIILDSKNKKVSAAGAILNFDPNFLKAETIIEGKIFGLYLNKKIDNQKGEIKISGLAFNPSLGKIAKPFSGKSIFAKIRFKTAMVEKSVKTAVNFYFLSPSNTTDTNIMEAHSAKDVLTETKNAEITLVP